MLSMAHGYSYASERPRRTSSNAQLHCNLSASSSAHRHFIDLIASPCHVLEGLGIPTGPRWHNL